jgi:hypothetical protein
MMNKLKNVFGLFLVLFLTLILFSCAKHTKPTPEINYHDDNLLNGLRIVNHGNSDFPDPFDKVKYFIDGRKIASHISDKNFEKLIELPPGEHHLTVDNGKNYICKYSFKIDRGQIGIFNNYNYYTYVMYLAQKEEANKAERDMPDLGSWGFQNANAQVMEKKLGEAGCYNVDNIFGKAICREYHDNLCR